MCEFVLTVVVVVPGVTSAMPEPCWAPWTRLPSPLRYGLAALPLFIIVTNKLCLFVLVRVCVCEREREEINQSVGQVVDPVLSWWECQAVAPVSSALVSPLVLLC